MLTKKKALLLITIFSTTLMLAQKNSATCVSGNCQNGYGTSCLVNGEKQIWCYTGNFVDGKFHGHGTLKLALGETHSGNWENGVATGQGIRIKTNGLVQSGIWKNGKLVEESTNVTQPIRCLGGDCNNGYGHSDDNGRIYKGHFKGSVYHGYGEMTYSNGEYYKGHWERGLPNGLGVRYYKNGHIDNGKWTNGKFEDKLKVWALVIGVANYLNIQPLTFTKHDAEKIYGFLKTPEGGAVPENQIKLLLNEEATKKNISNAMLDLFSQADSSDLIIFYFAGHGKEGAFLPFDYTETKDEQNKVISSENALTHSEVNFYMGNTNTNAKYRLCLADACHSGSFHDVTYADFVKNGKVMPASSTRSTLSTREKIKKFYSSFDNIKSGLAVIMSSASEEISLEAKNLRQGVFSYYFMQGLKGHADGLCEECMAELEKKKRAEEEEYIPPKPDPCAKDNIITVEELYNFIRKEVREYTFKFQNPIINEDVMIIRRKGRKEKRFVYDKKMPIGVSRIP